jgi:metallophosphoesterase (TIGR00282 family)
MTRILFLGDIFSKIGRQLVGRLLPELISHQGIDLALANAENAAGGVGLTAECARELLAAGLAALSGGNHTFNYQDFETELNKNSVTIRPANFPDPCPGRGFTILETNSGVKVGLGNLMGRHFMNNSLDCPFRRSESLIREMVESGAQITIIDFHAEATSEKMALAYHLDGKLGALLGTHTHVQTNDAQILPGGLAYVTDVGMTGPHQSVIGMLPNGIVAAFMTGRKHRFKPATEDPILEGAIIDFNQNGLADAIKVVRIRGLADIKGVSCP